MPSITKKYDFTVDDVQDLTDNEKNILLLTRSLIDELNQIIFEDYAEDIFEFVQDKIRRSRDLVVLSNISNS